MRVRGVDMHRLVLTGYLNSMVDQGILKVKEIKPSKIYSIDTTSRSDIYTSVGTVARHFDLEEPSENALALLHAVLARPVFLKELEKCNVGIPKDYKKTTIEDRRSLISRLLSRGIIIPQNNPLIVPVNINQVELGQMMRLLIVHAYNLKDVQTEDGSSQKTLD